MKTIKIACKIIIILANIACIFLGYLEHDIFAGIGWTVALLCLIKILLEEYFPNKV